MHEWIYSVAAQHQQISICWCSLSFHSHFICFVWFVWNLVLKATLINILAMQEMTMHYKKDVMLTDTQTVQWPVLWKVTLLSFSWRNWLSVFQENNFKNSLQYTAKPKWCAYEKPKGCWLILLMCVLRRAHPWKTLTRGRRSWRFAVSTQMFANTNLSMVNSHKLAEFCFRRKTKECKDKNMKMCWVTWKYQKHEHLQPHVL